ncbi:hypothetical protein BAE44_0017522 [Dichanthelium oligosanthes]|uniref:Uncharacterized protein n=1 Tax=Dichanthelium oligosanthes TaxID=888268 RepID=A0A1E5V8V5_9POAL|nr:hypothetical protein BAE44_0017522 [Dichanthelium oligosanthes]
MPRKHHDPEVSGTGRDGNSSGVVWDTGSSLYDSYELAAVCRLLDRRLLAAAGVLPLTTDEPPPAIATEERSSKDNKQQRAVVGVRARRKVTLRALFRAVATWAARPRQAPLAACACVGMVHRQGGAAVEPDVPSHGEL